MINPNFMQYNPMQQNGFMNNNPLIPVNKFQVMYVPNYICGDYDMNEVDFPPLAAYYPGGHYMKQVPVNNFNNYYSGNLKVNSNLKQKDKKKKNSEIK